MNQEALFDRKLHYWHQEEWKAYTQEELTEMLCDLRRQVVESMNNLNVLLEKLT